MFEVTGRESQWKTIYRELSRLAVGTTVTLKELQDLIPHAAPNSVRPAFYRAVKEVELRDQRTFVSVRGVGWRVAEAKEHEGLAKRQRKFARRRVDAGLRIAAAADRSALTLVERQSLDRLQQHMMTQQSMLRRLVSRDEERVIPAAQLTVSESALPSEIQGQVDNLMRLLGSHGIKATD